MDKKNNEKKIICEVLRLLRISNDLNIKELAEKIGISASYIAELEKGIKKPSFNVIEKYSERLGISKSTIMSFEEEFSNKDYSYQKMLLIILKKIVK